MTKYLLVLTPLLLVACGNSEPYTLYRSSPIIENSRIHIATFDADDVGKAYNMQNCQIAQELFQNQPGVTNKYWCEKGKYKE
jgi:uncharacterized protein YcfL